jgi:hypothetical protein
VVSANVAFSLAAAVTVLAAVKGALAVSIVFGVLAVGFLLRASETHWRS